MQILVDIICLLLALVIAVIAGKLISKLKFAGNSGLADRRK